MWWVGHGEAQTGLVDLQIDYTMKPTQKCPFLISPDSELISSMAKRELDHLDFNKARL